MAYYTTSPAEDIATVVLASTHADGNSSTRHSVEQVNDYLQGQPDYWLSVAIRFQQFIDPRNDNPHQLKAAEVTQCEPRIDEGTVYNVQRHLKKLTGLVDDELGSWLTYHGILLDKHRDRIPHKMCTHRRRR
jgi:hypothetical protein